MSIGSGGGGGVDNRSTALGAKIASSKIIFDPTNADYQSHGLSAVSLGAGVKPTAQQLGLDALYEGLMIWHVTDQVFYVYGTGSAWVAITPGLGASTLDAAYNGGQTITVDGNDVLLDGNVDDTIFQVTQEANSANDMVVLTTEHASFSGDVVKITQAGTGKDISGTDDKWSFTKAGLLDCDGATIDGAVTINNTGADVDFRVETDDAQYAIYADGAKDSVVLAGDGDDSSEDYKVVMKPLAFTASASGDAAGLLVDPDGITTKNDAGTHSVLASIHVREPNLTKQGTDVITTAATVYIEDAPSEGSSNWALCVAAGATNIQAVTCGAITATGNSTLAGTFDVTGNTTITGDLAITGALTFGGALTISDTVTVDELILDSDGSQPAGTLTYWVSDNTGDLTGNALTGKAINLAINNTDEYSFNATSVDLNGNHLDNAGYLIMNAVTAPAGTEVYAAHDNTGDLTLNCKTGKTINLAIAGTDEVNLSATAMDMNGNHVDNSGYVILNAVTNPAGSEVFISHDNSGDCTINALTGKEICFAINATDAVQISSSEVELTSGVNLQFLGDDKIVDSAGNELIEVSATGSATNHLLIKNAATANPVIISAQGTGSTADRGIMFHDSNGNEVLELISVNSATVNIGIKNAATTTNPIIQVMGEADIGMTFANYDGTNTEEILILDAVATGINEVTITNAASGGPTIAASGDDANIDLNISGKGTGDIVLGTNTDLQCSASVIYGDSAADGNLILHSTSNATKGFVGIADAHEGLKVGGTADRAGAVGDNAVHIFNGAAAPAGALANGVSLYSEGGECKVLDAAGNSTTLSPHTEDGDYVIHSYAADRDETVTIHLEKLLRAFVNDNPSYKKYFAEKQNGHVKKPGNVQ